VAQTEQRSTTEAWLKSLGGPDRGRLPLSAPLDLPAADELRVLTGLEQVRESTAIVAATGQRLISMFTPDLEPLLYDDPKVIEVFKRFVLSRSYAKVRVLVRDHTSNSGTGHRFMSMAKRLTSYLEVRILLPEHYHYTCSYCIADDRGIVYRMRSDRWEGIALVNNPPVARQYLAEFDVAWHASGEQFQRRTAHF
jgi:hypothetical protein